ncbi:toxin C-terminal domain-containing protein [Sodalis sp. dw_96]|uniref:toxin C-terminal domain-containing protein n=1 Tax=Sodalis sp. dw_96 TaxID=2719794 RepID=UPI0023DF7842|nr:toxin C-terminal domain-containing protein [Sodalis sp. dw_96]
MQFSEMRKEKSKLALAECLAKAEKKRNDKHENCLQLLAVQNKEKIASRDAACMQLQAERKERDRVCEASALKLSAERNERAKANEAKAQELRAADKALKEARFQQQAQPHATPIAPVTQCRPSAQQTTQTGLTNNALSTASPASAAGPAVGGLLTAAARGGQLAIDACAKNPACQNNIMGRFLNGLFGAGASANAVSSLNKTQQTNITLALMYGGTHPDTLANLSSVERTAYDRLIADSKDSKFNILPIPWNDPTEGKLVNPVVDRVGELSLSTPDQREEQGASHTGEKGSAPETVIGTTETPIPAGLDSDSLAYLALKGAEAREAAGKLGYNRRIPPQKAPFDSHGQPVFSNGKNYITPDVDSHNVTNGWKMFDHKGERSGTFDQSLNKIKD